ncbi:peptide chain release factor 1 [Fimbriimonas ginsengisoli]|uniref:Peptide chain release factor 1 n=1 Tax=Fimbriimonas ginsengisoli Gsoil 348 TaxID=661478 RepID=A0A068NNY7_FIMGI|nr:peptide chain release factor 1 [Fimbriimonas ginsengisoli]AIE85077.1 Peptide chain release factor 1 [Fimbriimonas ginsengisoli Gsoil 348]
MLDKLHEVERRFDSIEADFNNPAVVVNPKELQRLGKLRSELEPIVTTSREYRKAVGELEEAQEMLDDPEMREMAQAEIEPLRTRIAEYEQNLKRMLVPKDPLDDKPVIVEIRPAAGGDEAGLFASELLRMYMRYCERKRWKTELVEHEESGIGGLLRVVFNIDAQGAYSQLKFESGVHRVQRVPATESQGRIHTSTVTVAVLPEAEEVDLHIDPKELEISTFCSSSAGGQHMQKNETAIRIIHKPTGLVSTCQDERSQAQNKIKAMDVLRAKLLQMKQDEADAERSGIRKGQIGSGDRSEKIRTYNFPESRVTDHRIKVTIHNLSAFLDGDIQGMIDALIQDEQTRKLAEDDPQ